MSLERFAPAKVNLFLHVGPLQADGYHPIASLMTFASVGDCVRFSPAREMSFAIEGPFAAGLAGEPSSNLVIRARDATLALFPGGGAPFRITLEKNLPVAAGLGGGSSDAAAALHLMAVTLSLADQGADAADRLEAIARRLGSDVPACFRGDPVLATGRGDERRQPPVFPDLDVVLANPLVASPTAAVYRAYDDGGAPGSAEPPAWPDRLETPEALAHFLAATRNDLQTPAISLAPAIGEVLEALSSRTETLFARMSGSGASCFAICADERRAHDLARAIAQAHPTWWVQSCRLAGFHP